MKKLIIIGIFLAVLFIPTSPVAKAETSAVPAQSVTETQRVNLMKQLIPVLQMYLKYLQFKQASLPGATPLVLGMATSTPKISTGTAGPLSSLAAKGRRSGGGGGSSRVRSSVAPNLSNVVTVTSTDYTLPKQLNISYSTSTVSTIGRLVFTNTSPKPITINSLTIKTDKDVANLPVPITNMLIEITNSLSDSDYLNRVTVPAGLASTTHKFANLNITIQPTSQKIISLVLGAGVTPATVVLGEGFNIILEPSGVVFNDTNTLTNIPFSVVVPVVFHSNEGDI